MNGNVTREGITADLEAMQRVGIGGAQIFNVGCGIPVGPVEFLTPEWRGMMKHAAQEADRLDMELCLHNCAGWSSSGGPWNTPEHAMQRLVTSEVTAVGPAHFSDVLPRPPVQLGFYRDIELIAFPTPEGEEETMQSLSPKVTASVENIVADHLFDGRSDTRVNLPLPRKGRESFIQLEFARPFAARSVLLSLGAGGRDARGVIHVSDDGRVFRDLADFSFPHNSGDGTLSIALGIPVPARFYRVKFTGGYRNARRVDVTDVSFSPCLRTGDVLAKSGMNMGGLNGSADPEEATLSPGLAVGLDDILDITGHMDADGRLDWNVPAGQWTILRIGHTPTGRDNHPAPEGGLGLECDKMDPEALDLHWDGFIQKVLDDLGPLAGKGKAFNNVLIDSYEVGGQNWTPAFRGEFQRRRGYDPRPWLAAVTGRVVDSPDATERFLWDMRRTVADLFAENYYGHFRELCNRHGLTASLEPYTGPFESLQCGAAADIPMGEFWVGSAGHPSLKIASTVGHIYGRPVIGAESFTARPSLEHGRWLDDPYALKALGDRVFCEGINRYIFHRYAMQPWTNRVPGMTMGQWGTHFDRTCTWWEQGRAWMQYIARCQFMLQQGRFVADAAAFCGESAPVQMPSIRPDLPPGYDYDGINADVLLNHAAVEDGQLVLDSGMRYRVLALSQPDRTMTPELLRKLRGFVAAGLTLIGPPPEKSPSLAGYPACDGEIASMVAELWGECDGTEVTEHRFGKGRVVWGRTMEQVFAALDVKPDFGFSPQGGAKLVFIHRLAGDADIYFVSNQRARFESVDCTFRAAGRTPEFWYPDSGLIEQAPVWREEDGLTSVPIQFDPAGSVFVVFRKPAAADHLVSAQVTSAEPAVEAAPDDLSIIKAEYGVFSESPDGFVDVTDIVRRLVEGGRLRIAANNELAGDPAEGIHKELRIEYNDHGIQAVVADEGGTIELPAGADVIRAVYGEPGSKKADAAGRVDITAQVAAQVQDGRLFVKAGNQLAGVDPMPMVPKELLVEYRWRGSRRALRVAENSMLVLPEDHLDTAPPDFGLAVRPDGRTVFRAWRPASAELQTASGRSLRADVRDVPPPVELFGPWELAFPPDRGAPARVILPELVSWTEHAEDGVKYFSGTATYRTEFEWKPEQPRNPNRDEVELGTANAGQRSGKLETRNPQLETHLDLGDVKNIAEVTLNGVELGILWKPPFRVDISDAVRPGKNRLEIRITNLWPNRLIGDQQLPPDCEWNPNLALKDWPQWLLDGKPSPTGRLTFTTWHHWKKDDALLPSGLLGPVKIQTAMEVSVR
jgi:hypothetical protein